MTSEPRQLDTCHSKQSRAMLPKGTVACQLMDCRGVHSLTHAPLAAHLPAVRAWRGAMLAAAGLSTKLTTSSSTLSTAAASPSSWQRSRPSRAAASTCTQASQAVVVQRSRRVGKQDGCVLGGPYGPLRYCFKAASATRPGRLIASQSAPAPAALHPDQPTLRTADSSMSCEVTSSSCSCRCRCSTRRISSWRDK